MNIGPIQTSNVINPKWIIDLNLKTKNKDAGIVWRA